jgi:hypothetical protein
MRAIYVHPHHIEGIEVEPLLCGGGIPGCAQADDKCEPRDLHDSFSDHAYRRRT